MSVTTTTDAPRYRFAFKYKLALCIALIVAGVLAGTFFVLQRRIETEAVADIKQDLLATRELVIDLIADRRARLDELARAAGGSELVRIILTDPSLDRVTSDDIVSTEIMSGFPQLSLLSVFDHNGKIRGSNGQEIGDILEANAALRAGLTGQNAHGFYQDGGRYLQIVALPLLIGTDTQREVLGTIFVGMSWSMRDLLNIQKRSRAQIALLAGGTPLIAAGPVFARLPAADGPGNPSLLAQVSALTPEIHAVGEERFIFLKIDDRVAPGAPAFVIAQSLDAQLGFVKAIRVVMLQFAILGIAVGLAVSLVIAAGIARPIKTLTMVARLIAEDNYGVQVHVRTRDEFAQLGEAFNRMIAGLRERDLIRSTFGRYVDRGVAQRLLSRPELLAMGGRKRQVVILMADIRGFSQISELMTPEATIAMLNRYFARMIAVIKQHEGIVVDFVGDGLVAFFDPMDGDLRPVTAAAMQSAFQMQRALEKVNAEMAEAQLPRLEIGIGLNTGPAIVGNIGSNDRAKYGIVGAEVNLTQRIQGEAGPGEVVISQSMYALVADAVAVQRSFERELKGFSGTREMFVVGPLG